ncbi:chitin synthase-domain-containing protein, partial [Blyttiomyces helicus]
TSGPDDFEDKGYMLRQRIYGRTTEMFIVLTMYNEDEVLFAKTWKAVVKNITHMCSKKNSDMWGPDGWKKVVVCVVADGRTKIHPRTLTLLGVIGAYQDGVLKTSINNEGTPPH